nr:hypothetical protein [uncultured Psychroserpens sp.]
MKKTLLIIIILGFTNFVFGQSSEKKVEEFFKEIQCEKLLEQGFDEIESVINENKEMLFNKYELDFQNKTDVNEFDNFLKEEIDFFKRETYVYISDKYSRNYSEKQIQRFIDLAKDKRSEKDILVESNFRIELDSILQHQGAYLQNDIHLTLTKLRAKYRPLILKIFEKGTEIDISKIDLDFLLNTNDEQQPQISILNESNAEISLPANFDFEKVTSLTIRLNDENYLIERYNMNLPEMVRKVSSPLTKDGFEDLEFWILTIDDEKISLKIKVEVNIGR